MELAHFQEALKNLGPNDDVRGKVIGVDDRTVRFWRAKEPRIIRLIATNIDLARALVRDAEEHAGLPKTDS